MSLLGINKKNRKMMFLLVIWPYCLSLYRSIRGDVSSQPQGFVGHHDLYDEVLRYNSQAFDYISPGKGVAQLVLSMFTRVAAFIYLFNIYIAVGGEGFVATIIRLCGSTCALVGSFQVLHFVCLFKGLLTLVRPKNFFDKSGICR